VAKVLKLAKRQVAKLLFAIFTKGPVRWLLWRVGLEVRPRRPNLVNFLESRKIDIFLDVGANIGQTGRQLRAEGYRGRIVSFEPIKSVFEQLKRVAERDGNWEAYNFALGSAPARTNIKISENTIYSSMLDQTPEAQRFDRSARIQREEMMEVQRLDDIFSRFRGHRVFLKIVTQGFEREVLEGAQESLDEILGALLILPVVQLYRGNWSLPEALAYMAKRGFILGQTGQESFEGEERVTLLELYCIFRRENPNADLAKQTVAGIDRQT
jgi:FkbM family methyltransferase